MHRETETEKGFSSASCHFSGSRPGRDDRPRGMTRPHAAAEPF
jgi:hypothetical protein